jgi:hypothetical protein
MNIHINKQTFDFLMQQPNLIKFRIGSVLYNLNDDKSDTDYLILYHPFKNQLINPFVNHHQYQYKDVENNTDYNFIDIITFIRNLVNGDSTINYELLYSDEMKNSELSFLFEYRSEFRTYNIVKAYLGFADRDIRHLNKRSTEHDKKRGILHIKRSVLFADLIINNNFALVNKSLIDFKKNLFKETIMLHNDELIDMRGEIKLKRENLNKMLENCEIDRYLDPKIQKNIVEQLQSIIKINDNQIDLDMIYQSNEEPELKYN